MTTQEIIAGYLLAVVVSIPLALAVAYSRFMENAVYPVVVFLQIMPKIAIAPLFIIWFGFGFTPKLLLVFLLSFFPIVVSSIAGFKAVDRDDHGFRAHDRRDRRGRCSSRSACRRRCPHIFTGLKVGAALAATAAVVAEFVASDRGLGYLLLQYNGNLETPMVFATIVVLLSLIRLALYYAVEIIERIAIPWHVSQQAAARTDVTLFRHDKSLREESTMKFTKDIAALAAAAAASTSAVCRARRTPCRCASTGTWAACTCRSTTARRRASTKRRASTSRSTRAAAPPTPCRWSQRAPTRSASRIRPA